MLSAPHPRLVSHTGGSASASPGVRWDSNVEQLRTSVSWNMGNRRIRWNWWNGRIRWSPALTHWVTQGPHCAKKHNSWGGAWGCPGPFQCWRIHNRCEDWQWLCRCGQSWASGRRGERLLCQLSSHLSRSTLSLFLPTQGRTLMRISTVVDDCDGEDEQIVLKRVVWDQLG